MSSSTNKLSAPKNYFFDESFFQEALNQQHFVDKTVSFTTYEDAYIIPSQLTPNGVCGGVATKEQHFIATTALHTSLWGKDGEFVEFGTYEPKKKEEKVIFLGVFYDVWGHLLTDCLSRLWFLRTDMFRNHYSDYTLVYVSAWGNKNFKIHPNYAELLQLLGIDSSRFQMVTDLTQYQEVAVPDQSFFTIDGTTRFYTKEYKQMIYSLREIGSQLPDKFHYDKIYLSYTHKFLGRSRSFGEKSLERYFASKGFVILHPEDFSFLDQLGIYAHCSMFASTIGSCSHNIVFIPDNAEAILIPRAYYLTGYQVALNEFSKALVFYIDSSLSIATNAESPWVGPWFFYISKGLTDFYGEKKEVADILFRESIRDFHWYLAWWWLSETQIPPKYYLQNALTEWKRYKQTTIYYRAVAKIKRHLTSRWMRKASGGK